MTTEWRAIVTWPRPPDIGEEQLTALAEALPGFGIATADEQHVTAAMTVDGSTLRQATDAALRIARDVHHTGLARVGQPTQLRVLPVDAYDAELRRPQAQDLVGYAEAAKILEVSPQRVAQLARERPDFPAPIASLSMGPVFTSASVETFGKLPRRGGRPRKATD